MVSKIWVNIFGFMGDPKQAFQNLYYALLDPKISALLRLAPLQKWPAKSIPVRGKRCLI